MICLHSIAGLGGALRAIARARVAAGVVSGAELARSAAVSQPHVANWLLGRRELSVESVDRVRVSLGLGICELLACNDCRSLQVRAIDSDRRQPAAWRLVAIEGGRAA